MADKEIALLTLPPGHTLETERLRQFAGQNFLPGEKVRLNQNVRFIGEDDSALQRRNDQLGNREYTVRETVLDLDEVSALLTYRFEEIPGAHNARAFMHQFPTEQSYAAIVHRHDSLWFVPCAGDGQAENLVTGAPRSLGHRLTRAMRYAAGLPFDGSRDAEYIMGITESPEIGEFVIRSEADGRWSLDYVVWNATASKAELAKINHAIDATQKAALKAAINHTSPTPTAGNEPRKDAAPMAAQADNQPTNDQDSSILPPAMAYDEWNVHLAELAEAREQSYARDTMDIARQQARNEMTRAAEINEGVWEIRADDQGHGVIVLNTTNLRLLANPDRRTVQLPNERGQDIDQFRAAEALWHRYRRVLAGADHEAAALLNAAALAHRNATMPSATIEGGPVHSNAETTQHLSDEFMADRPYTVVAHTHEEAKVLRGFLEYASRVLPRDKQRIRAGSSQTIIPMIDGKPVLPSSRDIASAFNKFRPRHPAISSQKESVGIYVSHGAYEGVAPAMEAAQCAGRNIVALEGASADRSHADIVLPKVNHPNFRIAAWQSNVKLLEHCHRVVIVTNALANSNHRDPAIHLAANAVRAGKLISVFDGAGKQMDQFPVARIAVAEFKSERERQADKLRETLSNIGSLASPYGQIFLKTLGFSGDVALKLGQANITGVEIAEALGNPKALTSIAKQSGIGSATLQPFVEGQQRLERALGDTATVMHTMEQNGMRAITPFANKEEFPKTLASTFPVLFVDQGEDGSIAKIPTNGIAMLDDAHRLTQSFAAQPTQNPTIVIAGAAPRGLELNNAIVIVPGPLNKSWTYTDPTIEAAASRGVPLISADLPWPEHASSLTHGAETPTAEEKMRAATLVAKLARGAIIRDALANGIVRTTADAMLDAGKPLAIEDSSKLPGLNKDNSYVATLRAIVDAQEHLKGHARRAQDVQAHPDPDSITEKLRRSDRQRIREESAAISTLTPKQVEQITRTSALLTVIPRHEQYGPAMHKNYLATVNRSETPSLRAASQGVAR